MADDIGEGGVLKGGEGRLKGGDDIEIVGGGIYLKVVDAEERRIVAACDEEHLGMVYEDEGSGKVLDLDKNRYFYEGELAGEEVILGHMGTADSVNLVGQKAVALGKQAGLVDEVNIITISGVPHAQAYRIRI